MDWAVFLGWAGTALFLARLVPQPLKLHRTGDTEGVTPQSPMNALLSDAGWLAHGLLAGLPPVWVAAVAAIPLDLWTLWHLRRRVELRNVAGAAAWGAAIAAGGILGGRVGLGLVLGFSVVVNHVPQVIKALRSHSVSGLAPGTWWFGLADALLWGGYGVAEHDPALITYGVVLSVASVTILVAIWVKSGRAAPENV